MNAHVRVCAVCLRRVSTTRGDLPGGWLSFNPGNGTHDNCGSGNCIAEFFALLRQAMNREESEM
jgi:hypothetical protein